MLATSQKWKFKPEEITTIINIIVKHMLASKGGMSMLKGIRIKPINRLPDERGFFTEVMRKDWKDLFEEDTVAQANLSFTYPNIIRAWHRHLKRTNRLFFSA